jgi:hypothetical protein
MHLANQKTLFSAALFTRQRVKYIIVVVLVFACPVVKSFAQHKTVRGTVISRFTKERIPFASISWKKSGNGVVSDSAGNFMITAAGLSADTLLVSSVGFETRAIPIPSSRDLPDITVLMENASISGEVIVHSKYSKGLLWWRKVVANKKVNNPYRSDSYSYELYNKVEIDINNINRKKIDQNKLLRPFGFILDNIDSISENKPFLPVFLTESISDCYFAINPHREREEIKALKTNGIKNESIMQFMGGLNQRMNSYENYMSLFGKEFISPLSNFGDNYYNYKGLDTQYISGQRYLHLLFTPKRDGENTFSGDCWIHQATWGIKTITLNISPTANINYVNRLSLIQEFARQNDSVWVIAKDKFVAELTPLKKDKLSFIARKTSLYSKIQINQPFIEDALKKNIRNEKVVINEGALVQDTGYWRVHRTEPLSSNEEHVYKMIDTLNKMPIFKKYVNTVEFIVDGRKQLGKIEIGPWYKWISGNQLEKVRLRFDVATTKLFSDKLWLHGYLAYGFRDRAFKGKGEFTYKFGGKGGYSIHASYTQDLDNGRLRNNDEDITTDNLFSQLIRRPGIRQKFLQEKEAKAWIKKVWGSIFSAQLSFSVTDYQTFHPLPPKEVFTYNNPDNMIVTSELGLRLRYSPGGKIIHTRRKELRFNGQSPVLEAGFYAGIPGFLESNYQYQKLIMMISQDFRIPRWGKISYRVYGGKIFGDTLPFMMLEMHPGNEIYYYNKNTFNLMNRFEYISDRYVGFNIEHNFEKKLLNLLPFLRKTNMRQFWNIKAVWGDLSPQNKKLNLQDFPKYRLRSLQGNGYVEVGTGLDNIFKYFRTDLVWRFAPPRNPSSTNKSAVNNFGVFGSFHIQF